MDSLILNIKLLKAVHVSKYFDDQFYWEALTSQDLMSELEQGQNSASCLPELLEKPGYYI
ncbi:hypothetical protein EK904_008382 [Melospiza melodia maxima]|nr:hypothetical protein EK904_008382 [Melospiza melodia maxima]